MKAGGVASAVGRRAKKARKRTGDASIGGYVGGRYFGMYHVRVGTDGFKDMSCVADH